MSFFAVAVFDSSILVIICGLVKLITEASKSFQNGIKVEDTFILFKFQLIKNIYTCFKKTDMLDYLKYLSD